MTLAKIKRLFSAFNPALKIISYERLYQGLSNDNFLVRTIQHAYLLKYYREHWPSIGIKAQAVLAEQHVCPAPRWTDNKQKIAIFDYIEGDIAHERFVPQLLKKLVSVHNYPVITKPMDIKHELSSYQANKYYQYYEKVINNALTDIDSQSKEVGFCHNDLLRENIIVNQASMYLIDFEYASSNDIYFDLASLVVSFKLNESQKIELLTTYQRYLQQSNTFTNSLSKLKCYEVIYLVLCMCWYSVRTIDDKAQRLSKQLDHLINQPSLLCIKSQSTKSSG